MEHIVLKQLLEKYKKKGITLGKAAEIAGISLRGMMAFATKEKIEFQYSRDDLKEDFEETKK